MSLADRGLPAFSRTPRPAQSFGVEGGVVQEEISSKESEAVGATDAPDSGSSLSRGKFLAGAAVAGLAVGAPGVAKAASGRRNAALANGLAPGMIGGPTGFPGAGAVSVPGQLRGGARDPGAEGNAQGGQGTEHACRAGARLRATAVPEHVPEGRNRVDRGHLRARDGNQAQVHRGLDRQRSTRRTSATPRRRTAASTSSRARSRTRATTRSPGCSGRSTTTSRSTGRAGTTRSTGTRVGVRP